MTRRLPNEHDVHPYYRLGWQGPTRKQLIQFDKYLTAEPVTPVWANFMHNVRAWCGRTNFHFGTCGPNMIANLFVSWFMYAQGEQVTVTDDAIYDLYRRAGNPQFDPTTGNDDNGVDNAVLMGAMLLGSSADAGLDVTRADGNVQRVTISVFGQLSGTGQALIDQMKTATALFGGACIAVNLELAQQAQTVAHPPVWSDIPSSGTWGGHDIFGGRYTGYENDDEHVISWLVNVGVADGFIRARSSEVLCAVPTLALKQAPVAKGVQWSDLAGVFQQMTGRTLNLSTLAD
jgi:hypothetical protein